MSYPTFREVIDAISRNTVNALPSFNLENVKEYKPEIGMFIYENGSRVHCTANIYPSAELGENVVVGAYAEIGKNVQIGNNVQIGCGAFIPENVIIGNSAFIGPHVVFTNDKYPPSHGKWREMPPTVVEDHVAIGANSTIGPNIKIGRGSRIGMGSVVTKDIPEMVTAYGNPCKVQGKREDLEK